MECFCSSFSKRHIFISARYTLLLVAHPVGFAADVDETKAAFMAESQVPWGVGAPSGTISEPAWKTKPSWYLVATDDKMIPPPAQRFMSQRTGATVVEEAGSHAIYVSKPAPVAALIEQAVKGVQVTAN
jgi:pimeloyl-ACP methyl ester carboxylesterase